MGMLIRSLRSGLALFAGLLFTAPRRDAYAGGNGRRTCVRACHWRKAQEGDLLSAPQDMWTAAVRCVERISLYGNHPHLALR